MQTTKKNILYIILLLSAIIALTGCRLFDAGGQTNMNISESAYAFIPPPRSKFKLVFNPQHNIEGISLSPLPLIEVVPSSSEIDSLELPEQLQTLETDPDLVFREMMTQSRSQAYTWPYWKYPLYAAVGFPRDILATALDAACIGVAYTGGAVGFATSAPGGLIALGPLKLISGGKADWDDASFVWCSAWSGIPSVVVGSASNLLCRSGCDNASAWAYVSSASSFKDSPFPLQPIPEQRTGFFEKRNNTFFPNLRSWGFDKKYDKHKHESLSRRMSERAIELRSSDNETRQISRDKYLMLRDQEYHRALSMEEKARLWNEKSANQRELNEERLRRLIESNERAAVALLADNYNRQVTATADMLKTGSFPDALPGLITDDDTPSKLHCSAVLSSNKRLVAGGSVFIELKILNQGQNPAFNVADTLKVEPALLKEAIIVEYKSPRTVNVIRPGESVERKYVLKANDMIGTGRIKVAVYVGDLFVEPILVASLYIDTKALDPPDLQVVRWAWSDGNDETLAAGDRLSLRLWVQNAGLGKAEKVSLKLASDDGSFKLVEPFAEVVDLPPGEIHQFSWNVAVPEDWQKPVGTALPVTVALHERRERFSVAPEPLQLAFGDQSRAGVTAGNLASLEENTKAMLEEERRAKEQSEEIERRRMEAKRLQEELAKKRAEEEARLAAEQKRLEEERKLLEAQRQARMDAEKTRLAELAQLRKEREERARQAVAERQQLKARSYALIVGIDEYDDHEILPLKYAVRDAKALEAALTDKETGLFHKDNVVLLTTGVNDPALRPTKSNIMRNLVMLTSKLKPEDRFLFFFAGHGSTDREGDGNYLIAQNNSLQTVKYEGIQLREHLLDALEDCRAGQQVLIVDACHSGLRKARAADPRAITVLSKGIDEALEAFHQGGSGRFVLSSSSQDEVSHEDDTLQHGVFTYFLVEGLRSIKLNDRTEVDANLDGQISTGELFQHVRQNVENWCRQNQRQLQTPRSRSDDSGASIPLTGLQEHAAAVGE